MASAASIYCFMSLCSKMSKFIWYFTYLFVSLCPIYAEGALRREQKRVVPPPGETR